MKTIAIAGSSLIIGGLLISRTALAASTNFTQLILPLNCVFQTVNDGTGTIEYFTPAACGLHLSPPQSIQNGTSPQMGKAPLLTLKPSATQLFIPYQQPFSTAGPLVLSPESALPVVPIIRSGVTELNIPSTPSTAPSSAASTSPDTGNAAPSNSEASGLASWTLSPKAKWTIAGTSIATISLFVIILVLL